MTSTNQSMSCSPPPACHLLAASPSDVRYDPETISPAPVRQSSLHCPQLLTTSSTHSQEEFLISIQSYQPPTSYGSKTPERREPLHSSLQRHAQSLKRHAGRGAQGGVWCVLCRWRNEYRREDSGREVKGRAGEAEARPSGFRRDLGHVRFEGRLCLSR
jgi:hypothetical protein